MLEQSALSLSIILNFVLGLFVFLKNTKSYTNRLFFFLAISFALYSFINYASLHPFLVPQLLWIKLDLFNGVFLFLLTYLTFDVFPKSKFSKNSPLRIGIITYSLIAATLTLTPFVF